MNFIISRPNPKIQRSMLEKFILTDAQIWPHSPCTKLQVATIRWQVLLVSQITHQNVAIIYDRDRLSVTRLGDLCMFFATNFLTKVL